MWVILMKQTFCTSLSYPMEAILLLEETFYPKKREVQWFEQFVAAGFSKKEVVALFQPYRQLKEALIAHLRHQDWLDTFKDLAFLFRKIVMEGNTTSILFGLLLSSPRRDQFLEWSEAIFVQETERYLIELLQDALPEETIAAPLEMESLVRYVNQLGISSEDQMVLIRYASTMTSLYQPLMDCLHAVLTLMKPYQEAMETEHQRYPLTEKGVQRLIQELAALADFNLADEDTLNVQCSMFQLTGMVFSSCGQGHYQLFVGYLYLELLERKAHHQSEDQRILQVFKVLSDPTRFKVFQLLMHQPMYVQELARAVEVTPATLIHHIDQLMNAGLIRLSTRQEDRKRIYYIAHREAFQQVVTQLERMSVHEQ